MIFAETQFLWILWLVPGLVFFFLVTERARRAKLATVIDPQLWKDVLPEKRDGRRRIKRVLLVTAVALSLLALLRPQWGYQLAEISRRGIDLYLVVDTSESMRAEDVRPSRIDRAKREMKDLLAMATGDRIGLIPFAGEAYVACPLTGDYNAFGIFVDEIDTDLIPIPGSDLSRALLKAIESFKKGSIGSRAIFLLTDGEVTSGKVESMLKELKEMEIPVYVMGIGTQEGAPIPLRDGSGFKKDKEGSVIISRLGEQELSRLAVETGGRYVRSVVGDEDLEALYVKGIKKVLESVELKSGKKQIPIERFQFPLLAAFFLLLLEALLPEARKIKFPGKSFIPLVFLLLSPAVSLAWTPFAFDRGNLKYEKKEYEASSKFYRDALEGRADPPKVHYNLGNSLYRNGRFEEARDEFLAALKSEDPSLRERALYNLGDTRFRLGDLQGAIESYEQALALNAGDRKAALNRDYVKRLLEEKKEEEKKEEEKKDQEQEQEQGEKKEGEETDQEKEKEEEQAAKEEEKEEEMKPEEKKAPQKVSPDEGEALLESLDDDRSGAIREMVKRHTKKKETEVEKDW